MDLQAATAETIDDFLRLAARHFFSGSEAQARANLGPYDPAETSFILTSLGDSPVATATVRWNPRYPPFAAAGIPFIQNLEVRFDLRSQGYGAQVLEAIERFVRPRAPKLGICVALFDAYGPAQRLYARCGYLPDGRGACHRFTPLHRGEAITLDDDHLLWLVKDLGA